MSSPVIEQKRANLTGSPSPSGARAAVAVAQSDADKEGTVPQCAAVFRKESSRSSALAAALSASGIEACGIAGADALRELVEAKRVKLLIVENQIGGFFTGMGGAIEQLGSHFALDSVLLKYTRAEESQADILGTQILYDSGYDSRALAQFFEKVKEESAKGRRIRFFSDHPSPAHRIERVDKEVDKMGGPPGNYQSNSDDFLEIRRYLRAMPLPPPVPEKKIKGVSNEARLWMGRDSGD